MKHLTSITLHFETFITLVTFFTFYFVTFRNYTRCFQKSSKLKPYLSRQIKNESNDFFIVIFTFNTFIAAYFPLVKFFF